MSLAVEHLSLLLDDMPEVEVIELEDETVYVELRFTSHGEQIVYLNAEPELLVALTQAIFTEVMLHQQRQRSARIAAEAADLAEVE